MKGLKYIHIWIIFILAFAYNSVYSLAFMKSLYYQLMQSGLELSHFHLGQLYSIYGLFSMFSYLFGAYFLSRFSFWKLVTVSLFLIGILTLGLSLLPSYTVMAAVFGIIGFLLGAVFYPAHMQLLHNIGAPYCQGTVFSLFYMFNGCMGIAFAGLGFRLSFIPAPDSVLVRLLFVFFAGLNLISAVLAAVFLPRLPIHAGSQIPLQKRHFRQLLENRQLWIVILIVMTNYIAFSSLNYILLFLSDLYQIPTDLMNALLLMRTYLIAILAAPLAGRITDQFRSASRLLKYSFGLNIAALLCMLVFQRSGLIPVLICILLSCLWINMGKSMSLITIDEAGISPALYGISISFISFCAYSPDAFYYSVSGYLLDRFPTFGYDIIFLIVIAVSFLGYAGARKLQNHHKA